MSPWQKWILLNVGAISSVAFDHIQGSEHGQTNRVSKEPIDLEDGPVQFNPRQKENRIMDILDVCHCDTSFLLLTKKLKPSIRISQPIALLTCCEMQPGFLAEPLPLQRLPPLSSQNRPQPAPPPSFPEAAELFSLISGFSYSPSLWNPTHPTVCPGFCLTGSD